MEVICEKEVKGQISGLEWNSRHRFLVSSHGGKSNEICLWNWDGQQKLSKINGSKNFSRRVLNLLQSKEEDMVCTLSSDETLKFF
jgi:WD40 repeat protein